MKILINSFPRSGTSTFVHAIHRATDTQNFQWGDLWFYGDRWVAKSHIPIIFYAHFPKDITVGTILRNPIDAISSNVFRWSNGYTGNIVNNKIVIDKTITAKENKFDEELKDLIYHQTRQYIAYYEALYLNHKNFIMFQYEDIKNNATPFIREVICKAGGDYININIKSIEDVMNNPNLPTKEKTELYYSIKDYAESLDQIKQCNDLYNKLIPHKNTGLFI